MTLIIVLFIAGLALIFFEAFVPGGILGAIGAACLIASIFLCFRSGRAVVGYGLIGTCVVLIPLMVYWALGRMAHRGVLSVEDGYVSTGQDLSSFVGATGRSVTPLRPSGKGELAGHRLDVMSEGRFIQPDTPIEVIAVRGIYLVVRETAG